MTMSATTSTTRKRRKREFASEEERAAWLEKRAEQKRASYWRNREKEVKRSCVRRGAPGSKEREKFLAYFKVRYHQGEKVSRRARQKAKYHDNLEESRRYHREWKWKHHEEVNRRRRLLRHLRSGMSEESARMAEIRLVVERIRRIEAWIEKQEVRKARVQNPSLPKAHLIMRMLAASAKISEFQSKI